MKEFLSRLVLYIGSLAAVAFAFANPEPEKVITAVCAVLAYLAHDGWWFWARRVTPHDCELFRAFREALPSSSGHIKFLLSEHDFGNDFKLRLVDPLNQFVREWDNEEHRFHDHKLDKVFTDFRDTLKRFLLEIGGRTAPSMMHSDMQTSTVGDRYDDGPAQSKSRENRDVLNKLATECYEQHQKVMEQGRKTLRYQKEG